MKATYTTTGVPSSSRLRGVFNRVVYGLLKEAVNQTQQAVLEELKAPPRVKYPIEWQSPKQRRAYFATDGFGHGIPYVRTGKLEMAWRYYAVQTGSGGTLILENPLERGRFTYGLFNNPRLQQRMHTASGWVLVIVVRRRAFENARQLIRDGFIESLVAFGRIESSRI